MKKISAIIVAVVMFAAFTTSDASAQNRRYYYYPSTNIYYDVAGRQYVFNNGGTWSSAKTLPSGVILVKGSPRVTVYHPGNDVWVNNAGHVTKYKDYKGKPMMKHKGKHKN